MSKHILKLGKLPHVHSAKDLKLEDYLDLAALPTPPAQFGHEDKMPLPRLMLGNGPDDSVKKGFQGAGDCVFAGICNVVRLATAIAGTPARFTGKEAIAAYSAVTGYVIGNDSTDNGTDMRTALNWFRTTGIKDADGKVHKLGAYATINLKAKNLQRVIQALYLLDIGVLIGINFPDSAMTQFDANQPWNLVKGAKSEGGHCVMWDAVRANPMVETWARDQQATLPFLVKECDEAYALFMPDAFTSGKSLEGIDLAALQADLAALTA